MFMSNSSALQLCTHAVLVNAIITADGHRLCPQECVHSGVLLWLRKLFYTQKVLFFVTRAAFSWRQMTRLIAGLQPSHKSNEVRWWLKATSLLEPVRHHLLTHRERNKTNVHFKGKEKELNNGRARSEQGCVKRAWPSRHTFSSPLVFRSSAGQPTFAQRH